MSVRIFSFRIEFGCVPVKKGLYPESSKDKNIADGPFPEQRWKKKVREKGWKVCLLKVFIAFELLTYDGHIDINFFLYCREGEGEWATRWSSLPSVSSAGRLLVLAAVRRLAAIAAQPGPCFFILWWLHREKGARAKHAHQSSSFIRIERSIR